MANENVEEFPDFSFVEGGPGDALMKKLRMIQPQLGAASARTAILLLLITWLPLLVFSILEGLAWDGARIPFLKDIGVHTRFLIAVPVLVLAEIPIGKRLRGVARHFLNAGLVSESERKLFANYAVQSVQMNRSRLAEIALVATSYITTYLSIANLSLHGGSTWFEPSPHSGLSAVGCYYAFLALPLFQFLILRWAFRMITWTRFLLKVSNLNLLLTPTHPDCAGGLGFLGKGTVPFGILLFALSSVVSGAVASRILFGGAKLEEFQFIYIALILFFFFIFTGPLTVFAPRLFRLKQEGYLKYGTLASRYTQQFDKKWILNAHLTTEPLLGTADLQSLADLGNSYELVNKIRIIPIQLSDFVAIVLSGLVPALPLLLAVMPIGEILKNVLRLIG